MLCKWCGMESATNDQCSWCHRPLSGAAPESGESAASEPVPKSRPPVTLRRGPLQAPLIEPGIDNEESLPAGASGQTEKAQAPWGAAPPIAPPSNTGSSASSGPSASTSGQKRTGKNGPHMPAPAMPPGRYTRPTVAPVPHRHLPAPAILPISQQNRAGGSMPKSPYTAPAPIMAPSPRPSTGNASSAEPPLTAAQAHAANLAEGMPAAEPGGLAEGLSAPRSAATTADINVPNVNAIAAEQSKYYPGQVVDPTSGTHYEAATGKPTDAAPARKDADIAIEWETPVTSMSTLVVRYLFAFSAVVAIACLLAHAYREYYPHVLIAALFTSGLLLPVMNVVPKQRDDSDDVWWYLGITMIFGPCIGLIMYGVLGLLKQSVNPAVLGSFIVSILLQLAIFFAASPTALVFGPPWVQHGFNITALLINWASFATLAGWASANVFHRFDE